jgi:predicted dehydrogenase
MGVRLRVGIIGLGPAWESRHSPALHALADRFEVRAICDPVARRAEFAAHNWGIRHVDSFRKIVTAADVDAVMLLSARWYGALPILAACDAGKAVYCAASLELTEAEADMVEAHVKEAGIAFMAEFPCRLAPATLRLKELIATRLGEPRLLFCNQRLAASRNDGRPQSATVRQLVEMIDWCRYVVDAEPTSVMGTVHTSQENQDQQDYLAMTLDFSTGGNVGTGPMAQIACGSYVPNTWSEATSFRRPADLQIICEKGIAFIDLPNSLVWFDGAGQHTESLERDRPVGEQLLLHFHRSVSSLVLKTSSLDDAYRAVSILIHAQQSCTEGKRIYCDR